MKRALLILLLFTFLYNSFAQVGDGNSPCPSPAQCSRILILPIPALQNPSTILIQDRSYAKDPTHPSSQPASFHDVSYAGPAGCGGSKDCTGDGSILMYRVFYPSDQVFTYSNTCKLPVFIYFHGGSFADCHGSYLSSDLQTFCTEFAQRGFIVISVEYRTGVIIDPNSAYYSVQQMLAIWRACQDARGAIRSIVRREENNEEVFRIDESNIFIGGNSAGSVIAMNVADYGLSSMLTSAFPSGSSLSSSNVLGDINQDYYYGGDGTAVTGGYNFTIKGVLDLWGGVLIPANKVNSPESFFFQNGNTVPPTIAFCGKNDPVFFYDKKALKFPATESESYCLNDRSGTTSYTVTPQVPNNGFILGSQNIYKMLIGQHVLTEFYLDCDMGHGLDDSCLCSLTSTKDDQGNCGKPCSFLSDFGTGYTGPANVNLYIVQRAATFFQAVMNGKLYTDFTTTKFVECQNNRYSKCTSTADNNNSCPTDANLGQQVCPAP